MINDKNLISVWLISILLKRLFGSVSYWVYVSQCVNSELAIFCDATIIYLGFIADLCWCIEQVKSICAIKM